MASLRLDRRRLMLSAASAAAGFGAVSASAARDEPALFAAACRSTDGSFAAVIFDAQGVDRQRVPLPARGHDVAVCPVTGRCVVFARRPGTFALVFGLDGLTQAFATPPDRHFYGHGVFSLDGQLLYATENDFVAGRGVIGIYDVDADFTRIGEFPSYGVGPHELGLLPGGTVLAVANGGLREDPRVGDGRTPVGADPIVTGLALIDTRTGDLLEQQTLGEASGLSLRHFAIAPDGSVILGGQAISSDGDPDLPLLYRGRRGGVLEVFAGAHLATDLGKYVTSVAIDSAGTMIGVTSAKSGRFLRLDLASGAVIESVRIADVAGIAATAPDRGGFITTSGFGAIDHWPGRAQLIRSRHAFDNHAVAVTVP